MYVPSVEQLRCADHAYSKDSYLFCSCKANHTVRDNRCLSTRCLWPKVALAPHNVCMYVGPLLAPRHERLCYRHATLFLCSFDFVRERCRYQCFADQKEFEQQVQRKQPHKIDIGAVFTIPPKVDTAPSQQRITCSANGLFDLFRAPRLSGNISTVDSSTDDAHGWSSLARVQMPLGGMLLLHHASLMLHLWWDRRAER